MVHTCTDYLQTNSPHLSKVHSHGNNGSQDFAATGKLTVAPFWLHLSSPTLNSVLKLRNVEDSSYRTCVVSEVVKVNFE